MQSLGAEIKFNLMGLVPDRLEELKEKVASATESQKQQLMLEIEDEKLVRERWRKENERRRHNYISLITVVLEKLSLEGKLDHI